MKKILIIGSANADLTIKADRMPKLGETIIGKDFFVNAGGKGANQAVAVAKLGGEASFICAVGNDANGKILLENLKANGINFEGVITDSAPTGTASITVVNGDNFIILNQGANALMTPEIINEKESLIAENDYLMMQLEIPVETVLQAAKAAKKAGKIVVLNPAPYVELPDEIYPLIDIIVPNEHEASLLTGIKITTKQKCKEAVRVLMAKGVKTVIITLGNKGCAFNEGEDIAFVSAFKSDNIVDTTSAGDSFIGALVCKLAEGETLKTAIGYATLTAFITICREGASASIPYAHEVKEFICK